MKDDNSIVKADPAVEKQTDDLTFQADGELVHPQTATGTINQLTVRSEFSSGPIPSPEVFARYQEVDPAIPLAIIDQWNKQCDHTREMDIRNMDMVSKEVTAEIDLRMRGQDRAFMLCLTLLLIGGVLILADKVLVGSLVGASAVAGPFIQWITNNCMGKKDPEPETAETSEQPPPSKKKRKRKKKRQ